MALKLKVKVGGITNLSEARYCAGMGCDYLGFPVGGQGLSVEEFKDIAGWVSGPTLVLELDHLEGDDVIHHILKELKPPLVQVLPRQLGWVPHDERLMVTLASGDESRFLTQLAALTPRIEALVLAANFGKEEILKLSTHYACLWKMEGRQPPPWLDGTLVGLDLAGRTEHKPGYVEEGKLNLLLESLEADA